MARCWWIVAVLIFVHCAFGGDIYVMTIDAAANLTLTSFDLRTGSWKQRASYTLVRLYRHLLSLNVSPGLRPPFLLRQLRTINFFLLLSLSLSLLRLLITDAFQGCLLRCVDILGHDICSQPQGAHDQRFFASPDPNRHTFLPRRMGLPNCRPISTRFRRSHVCCPVQASLMAAAWRRLMSPSSTRRA